MFLKLFGLIFFLCSIEHSFAWGLKGHQITVQIAEKFLTPKARKEIGKIFKQEGLSQHAYWADKVAYVKEWKYTAPWHYVSVSDEGEFENEDTSTPDNILKAIQFCSSSLSSDLSQEEKETRLKFLIHLMGDIHQPLHVGRKEDEGGNKVKVYFGKKSNLHSLWDTAFIEKQGLSSEEYVARLVTQNRSVDELNKSFDETILIKENLEHRSFIYSFKDLKIDEKYEKQALEVIEARLWLGGIRLAALLNKIFI